MQRSPMAVVGAMRSLPPAKEGRMVGVLTSVGQLTRVAVALNVRAAVALWKESRPKSQSHEGHLVMVQL